MRRAVFPFLLLLLAAASAPAQTPPTTTPTVTAPPDLVLVQKKWQTFTRNPALDADPFDANDDFEAGRQLQRANEIRNTIRARGSESREPPPVRASKIEHPDSHQIVKYIYRARLRNTGAKTVRVIDWGYTFLAPETQEELGRHPFTTRVKLRPGQESELVGRDDKPQTSTIDVKNAGKTLVEQIVIYRIEYDDGSVWQLPQQ